jgi:hypothetical protein
VWPSTQQGGFVAAVSVRRKEMQACGEQNTNDPDFFLAYYTSFY